MGNLRSLIRLLVPRWVILSFKELSGRPPSDKSKTDELPEWEYRACWAASKPEIEGWNVPSIAEKQREKWPAFLKLLDGTGPFGISHEASEDTGCNNLWAHNLIASYGYVLGLAAHRKEKISLLDWGGGIGHYYVFSKALFPQLEIDYYCEDVPALCEVGRTVLPDATFFDQPNQGFDRVYDFVLAGSSLWYAENWEELAVKLAQSTRDYLYVTRMMFIMDAGSFAALQRPWKYGYKTEYQFWILNQKQFVQHIEKQGLTLVREFLFGQGPHIDGAPEQGFFKGFLFKRSSEVT